MAPKNWQWITGKPSLSEVENSQFYLFDGEKLIVTDDDQSPLDYQHVLDSDISHAVDSAHFHISDDGSSFITAYIHKHAKCPSQFIAIPIRQFLLSTSTDNTQFYAASRARQTLTWFEHNKYCGKCGKATKIHDKELAMCCHSCRLFFYPRISPCIIVLIYRERELLLARNANFPANFYSHVAGFVDPGETPEQCVRREAYEELSVRVDNIKYAGSQPWPFPQQLMLGFTARYAGGDIQPDGSEIVDAGWWHADNLPPSPSPTSLSGALIAQFIAGKLP